MIDYCRSENAESTKTSDTACARSVRFEKITDLSISHSLRPISPLAPPSERATTTVANAVTAFLNRIPWRLHGVRRQNHGMWWWWSRQWRRQTLGGNASGILSILLHGDDNGLITNRNYYSCNTADENLACSYCGRQPKRIYDDLKTEDFFSKKNCPRRFETCAFDKLVS